MCVFRKFCLLMRYMCNNRQNYESKLDISRCPNYQIVARIEGCKLGVFFIGSETDCEFVIVVRALCAVENLGVLHIGRIACAT